MDVLLIVSNVQQVPPDQLAASQEETDSSNRFVLLMAENECSLELHLTKGIFYRHRNEDISFPIYISTTMYQYSM